MPPLNLPGVGPLVIPSGSTGSTPAQFDNSLQVPTTAFVQRALGNLAGLTYAGTRTLTAADAGRLCGLASDGAVLTLPLGSTLQPGAAFYFWNGTANAAGTVQRQGTDTIFLASTPVTSVQCNGGESLVLLWAGSAWYAIGGSASLSAASASFGASLSASGRQRLPNGLLLQWASVAGSVPTTVGADMDLAGSWPVAFNSLFNVQATVAGSAAEAAEVIVGFLSLSNSGFTVRGKRLSGSNSGGEVTTIHVFGIGT